MTIPMLLAGKERYMPGVVIKRTRWTFFLLEVLAGGWRQVYYLPLVITKILIPANQYGDVRLRFLTIRLRVCTGICIAAKTTGIRKDAYPAAVALGCDRR